MTQIGVCIYRKKAAKAPAPTRAPAAFMWVAPPVKGAEVEEGMALIYRLALDLVFSVVGFMERLTQCRKRDQYPWRSRQTGQRFQKQPQRR